MKRFVEGDDRRQSLLLPDSLDDYVCEDNPVRVVEVFIDELDLGALGFEGVAPASTGRPRGAPQRCKDRMMGRVSWSSKEGTAGVESGAARNFVQQLLRVGLRRWRVAYKRTQLAPMAMTCTSVPRPNDQDYVTT